jgi:putative endonuclease
MPIKSDPKTWKDPRQKRGLEGEYIAARYLECRGWRVLAHRFRMGRLEVDLIVRRERVVAFVEVKTRRSLKFGAPIQAVSAKKQREIARVACAWVDRHYQSNVTYRFDVIGVTMGRSRPAVQHVENAFWPGWR